MKIRPDALKGLKGKGGAASGPYSFNPTGKHARYTGTQTAMKKSSQPLFCYPMKK